MEQKRREQLWEIVKRYLKEKDSAHGLSHIRRLCAYFNLFKGDDPVLTQEVLDAIEYSVLFHDIGYSASGKNHSEHSARILGALFKGELSDIQNQEWILYAVANHSTGLAKKKAKDEREICLALLCLFDHLDAIGAIGIFRTVRDFGPQIPLVVSSPDPGNTDFEKRIRYFLARPGEITNSLGGMKKSSILEHLTYQYGITLKIVSPVRHLIDLPFKKEIEERMGITKGFVKDVLEETYHPEDSC